MPNVSIELTCDGINDDQTPCGVVIGIAITDVILPPGEAVPDWLTEQVNHGYLCPEHTAQGD